jgi:MraZ protein
VPFGEYPYAIDDKGRVVVPGAFRDFVEDGMVLTRGMEGCLYVFPLTEWKRIEDALVGLPLNDAAARNYVRFFYSGATKLRMDGQGRISIPTTLRAFAGLDGEVLVAGAPSRLEIWDNARWNKAIATMLEQPPASEALPEALRSLVG